MNDDTQLIWEVYESSPRARFSDPRGSVADPNYGRKRDYKPYKVLTVNRDQFDAYVTECEIVQGDTITQVLKFERKKAEVGGRIMLDPSGHEGAFAVGNDDLVVVLGPQSRWHGGFVGGDDPYAKNSDAYYDKFEAWVLQTFIS